jgi:hypothetical protein
MQVMRCEELRAESVPGKVMRTMAPAVMIVMRSSRRLNADAGGSLLETKNIIDLC